MKPEIKIGQVWQLHEEIKVKITNVLMNSVTFKNMLTGKINCVYDLYDLFPNAQLIKEAPFVWTENNISRGMKVKVEEVEYLIAEQGDAELQLKNTAKYCLFCDYDYIYGLSDKSEFVKYLNRIKAVPMEE